MSDDNALYQEIEKLKAENDRLRATAQTACADAMGAIGRASVECLGRMDAEKERDALKAENERVTKESDNCAQVAADALHAIYCDPSERPFREAMVKARKERDDWKAKTEEARGTAEEYARRAAALHASTEKAESERDAARSDLQRAREALAGCRRQFERVKSAHTRWYTTPVRADDATRETIGGMERASICGYEIVDAALSPTPAATCGECERLTSAARQWWEEIEKLIRCLDDETREGTGIALRGLSHMILVALEATTPTPPVRETAQGEDCCCDAPECCYYDGSCKAPCLGPKAPIRAAALEDAVKAVGEVKALRSGSHSDHDTIIRHEAQDRIRALGRVKK